MTLTDIVALLDQSFYGRGVAVRRGFFVRMWYE